MVSMTTEERSINIFIILTFRHKLQLKAPLETTPSLQLVSASDTVKHIHTYTGLQRRNVENTCWVHLGFGIMIHNIYSQKQKHMRHNVEMRLDGCWIYAEYLRKLYYTIHIIYTYLLCFMWLSENGLKELYSVLFRRKAHIRSKFIVQWGNYYRRTWRSISSTVLKNEGFSDI